MKYDTDNWPYAPAKFQKKVTGVRKVRGICLHDVEGPEGDKTAENVAHYFQIVERPASAHICVDSDSIVQCVLDNNVAFAAPGVNHDFIHIELAGYEKQTEADWLDTYGLLMLERAAQAAAQYCLKYDVPVVHLTNAELKAGKRGFIGHYQATKIYKPNAGHTDPGVGFPWKWFMDRVLINQSAILAIKP